MADFDTEYERAKRGVSQQATQARADIEKQYTGQRKSAEEQAATARAEVSKQAEADRTSIRNKISQAEVLLQRNLQEARGRQSLVRRQRAIGGKYSKITLPDVSSLEQSQRELVKLRESVNKAEASDLSNIQRQADDILADLSRQKEAAISSISKQEAEALQNITLQYLSAKATEAYNESIRKAADTIQKALESVTQGEAKVEQPALQKVTTETVSWGDDFIQLPPTKEQIEALGAQNRWEGEVAVVNPDGTSAIIYPSYAAANGEIERQPGNELKTDADIKEQMQYSGLTGLSQADLKAEYEKQQKLPIWQQQLFSEGSPITGIASLIGIVGSIVAPENKATKAIEEWLSKMPSYSVIYDKERDKYSLLLTGVAPGISPAQGSIGIARIAPFLKKTSKGVVTITKSADDVGMGEAQFARFLKARVLNNKLTPEAFKAMDTAWKVQASTFEMYPIKPVPTKPVTSTFEMYPIKPVPTKPIKTISQPISQPLQKAAQEAEAARLARVRKNWPDTKRRWVEQMEEVVKQQEVTKRAAEKSNAAQIVKEAERIYEQTNKAVNEIIASTQFGKAEVSSQLLKALPTGKQLITAISLNPQAIAKALSTANAETKSIVENNLSTELVKALRQGNATKAQELAATQMQTNTQAANITSSATQLANQLKLQGATQTQVQNKVETFVANEIKAQSVPQVKTQLKLIMPTIVNTALQSKEQTITKTKSITPTPTKPEKPSKGKVPIPIILPGGNGKAEIKLTAKQAQGIVAWKQGFVYILKYPDASGKYPDKNTYHSRKPIGNVKYEKGIGSAARSIIARYGAIPEDIKFDMGIQDVVIGKTLAGRKPRIEFELDKRLAKSSRRKVHTQTKTSQPSLSGTK